MINLLKSKAGLLPVRLRTTGRNP